MAFDLAAALKDVPKSDTGREQIQYIPLSQIDKDPNNFYQLEGIAQLADNIALCNLQQPIRVRQNEDGRYIIVSGHRRRAALEMLVADGYEKFREAACIVEQDEVSPALQQLRLIYANANTRKMTSAEISEQAQQVEKLLYQLKEEGYDFPGRMRDHVAEAVQVSKSKLARLKVIRENLAACWADDWKNGTIGESVAYNLSQMPKSWQTVVHNVWGKKADKLYADTVANAKERFQRVTKIQCQQGLNLCEHTVTMMEKNCKEMYYAPCNGCCLDCVSLQTCKSVCPQAAAKQKEKKAAAKQAEREAKRVQPYIDMARLVYERVGIARARNKVSVEKLFKAQKRFYNASIDDKRQKDYERGVGNFSDNTDLPFGYSVRPSLLITIRDVADTLGCSVDYLLGRTEDREAHLSNAEPQNPVPYQGTCFQTGEPVVAGDYILLMQYPRRPMIVELWEWDGGMWVDGEIIYDPDFHAKIIGWIPMPDTPGMAQTAVNNSCITGMSPSGQCGAAAHCNKEYTCCLQCPDDSCNGRCGWIDDVAEEI